MTRVVNKLRKYLPTGKFDRIQSRMLEFDWYSSTNPEYRARTMQLWKNVTRPNLRLRVIIPADASPASLGQCGEAFRWVGTSCVSDASLESVRLKIEKDKQIPTPVTNRMSPSEFSKIEG